MDTQPSTSHYGKDTACLSPTKKRPRKALTVTEKIMISNTYKYVCQEESAKLEAFEVLKKDECVSKVAEILGIGKRVVYLVLKEAKENKDKPPKPPKNLAQKYHSKQDARHNNMAPTLHTSDYGISKARNMSIIKMKLGLTQVIPQKNMGRQKCHIITPGLFRWD